MAVERSGAAVALLLAAALAQAAPAHQHGVARLDAVLDGPLLTVSLSLPLDSLLGFERAPRSAAEKQAGAALVERLRTDALLVQPDPAAGCVREAVEIASPALGVGSGPGDAGGEHADVDASWRFRCADPARLGHVELGLMKAWPRLLRVEAQLVGARGQARQVLRRPATRLAWPR